MELTLISDVQLGSVIEIEYTICDDGGGPISSNPLTFLFITYKQSEFINYEHDLLKQWSWLWYLMFN